VGAVSERRIALRVRTSIAVALLAVTVVIATNTFGAPTRHPAAFWRQLGPQAFATAACLTGAAIPSGFYNLGPSFRGLRASREIVDCLPSRTRRSVDGPRRPTGYVYLTYGTCDSQIAPCRDPLEIQTWAECARNPNSYTPERGPTRQAEELNPSEHVTVPSVPELPAAVFEAGTRIELYGGGTTVVIFAPEVALGRHAAGALAQALVAHASPTTPSRLRAEAAQPGDASRCHHLLATGR
jgi:hypothetical protein